MRGGKRVSRVEKNRSYLEEELDTTITYHEEKRDFIFQRAKVKLSDELEIQMLKTMNPELQQERNSAEDPLIITNQPPTTDSSFNDIYQKSNPAKWQFAYNIIQRIRDHSLQRLKLIRSPDNISFDLGLVPHFLHDGVS